VGVLTRAFPPELVDEVIEVTGTQRRRPLPARLMVYFALALWLFRGRNCGYGQVMAKLTDGLYCQRRGADLLAGRLAPGERVDAGGGRQWWLPNISSLSRGRGKLGADPVRMLFEHVAGADGAPGVFCCGLRVVSMDGSVTDVPDSPKNAAYFGRPSNQSRDGAFPQARWVAAAAESGTGSLLGAAIGRYTDAEQPLAADLLGCFGPGMLVLADRKFLSWAAARAFLATGAQLLWRASASFTLKPVQVLADGTYLAELKPPRKKDGPRSPSASSSTPRQETAASRSRRCSAWSPTCPTWRSTRRWTWPARTPCAGAARQSSATTRPTWARASPCCAPATPRASCRRCGRCSPSTRPSAGSPGSPRTRRASPRTRSASRTPWPPRPPLWRLYP
jgi:Insertion element 4 transposase N-terminal